MWVTGAYMIRNKVNGKVYVGGAYKSFDIRFQSHLRTLKNGRHINKHLLSAWKKYGEDQFEFVILERCDSSKEKIISCEQKWIDHYEACNRKKGYNRAPTAGSPLGVKHTAETRRKYSAAMKIRMQNPEERKKVGRKGKIVTEETRKIISKKGKLAWKRAERREAFSKVMKGRKHTEEHCQKISAALTGRELSADHRKKLGLAKVGKKQSAEHIEKRTAYLRGKKRPAEVVAKVAAANRGKIRTPEWIENLRKAQQKRFANPEERAKMAFNKGRKMSPEEKAKRVAAQNRPEVIAKKAAAAKAQWERIRNERARETEERKD